MSGFASPLACRGILARRAIGGALMGGVFMRGALAAIMAAFMGAAAAPWPALAAETVPPPDFAPNAATGWLAEDDEFIPPPSGPGPILSDPPASERSLTLRRRSLVHGWRIGLLKSATRKVGCGLRGAL